MGTYDTIGGYPQSPDMEEQPCDVCGLYADECECQLYDGMIEMPVDERGYCLCEDDEDPSMSCEDYREQ